MDAREEHARRSIESHGGTGVSSPRDYDSGAGRRADRWEYSYKRVSGTPIAMRCLSRRVLVSRSDP